MTYLYVFLAVLAAIVVAGYVLRWSWTGLRTPDPENPSAKTLWDWMALLIVPFVLAAGAYGINGAQKSRDLKRENARARQQDKVALDQRRADTLRAYLQQMSGLIADHDLARTKNESLTGLASSLTRGVLRQLDGERKGEVVQFLVDARLIPSDTDDVIVDLYRSDLRGANLRGAYLLNAWFNSVDLTGADLHGAVLDGADFADSNLRGADLSATYYVDNDLEPAGFERTCLTGTRFRGAVLYGASFEGARGRDVDFTRADLDDTDFGSAKLAGIKDDGATYVDARRPKPVAGDAGRCQAR